MSFISTMTFAQDATLSAVDLRKAITQTLNLHPELKSFAIQTQMYSGYAQQAGIKSRPQVGFSIEDALGTGEHSGFKSTQSTLSISWLLDGELVQQKVQTAKNYGSTVAIEQEVKALDLAAQTARYFIQVLVNKERLTLAKFSLSQANKSLAAIDKRVKAGKSSIVDKLKASAEVAKRELVVEDLTHEVDASKYQLFAQWMQKNSSNANDQQHKSIDVFGSLLSLPLSNSTDFNALFNKLKQVPSVSLFATKQRIAQSEIELARIETKPLWQFSAGLRRYETTDDFGLVAGISIPFGETNQNQGKIKALTASQNKLETESVALVHKLNSQLYILIEQLKHSHHVIYAVTNNIIPILEQAFNEAEKAYNIGMYSYTDWMNTQQALLNAQSDLITAYQNAQLNNIEIERLTGSSIIAINQAASASLNNKSNEK
ncbi:TolC family protein [Colwellia sp. M166]|nr:TolC family protein [Colwellia sp. M166]